MIDMQFYYANALKLQEFAISLFPFFFLSLLVREEKRSARSRVCSNASRREADFHPTSLPHLALSQPSTSPGHTHSPQAPFISLSHVAHVTHLTLGKMFYSHEVLTSRKYGVATVWYA